MIVTALALDAAQWTQGLGALVTVSFFAVGFGFLLARSHYSELLALILSSVYSLAVVIGVNALTAIHSGALHSRVYTLASELDTWINEALAGKQPANDDVAFIVFLSVLFWFLGHNAAWHVFRVDRVWRVIIPTGLVLITNQFYYQGDHSLDIYLAAFVFLSLLLLIRSHIDAREFDWYLHRVSFPPHVRRAFFQAGAVLAVVIVLAAWLAPAGADAKSMERLNDLLSSDPFMKLADLWNRLFSSLESQGIATADYYGGEKLQLSGAIQLGDAPVMVVEAPQGPRYYWRSTIYDTYDFSTWEWKHIRSVRAYTENQGLEFNIGDSVPGARSEVDQRFKLLIRASELIYAAPQPVYVNVPVEAELNCQDSVGRTCVNEGRPADVAIIRAREVLRKGDSYSARSSITTASATMLREAGELYPDWVLRQYLQGANNLSPRVRDLAAQIVAGDGAQTPYDKARAIEHWLRTNILYNESIPTPPQDSDPIEWFLFDEQQGYCNYYASAMVLMLRSQGVPARIAAGFAQGEWDPSQNAYLVRERDAHTWVEVYFPGYGWVEFEPTADEAPIEREGDQTPPNAQLTPPALPTPTMVPTFTPTVEPTQPSGAEATPTGQLPAPFIPSTPTPSPTSSVTPPPPPDVTKVGGDNEPSIGKTILLTLMIFAAVVILLLVVIVFAIWYIEYRGLGHLNAVQRAYARLGIYGRWLGLRLEQSSTPDERRRYLVGEVPEGEQPINTITHAYVEDRYAAPGQADGSDHVAQTAWQEARWAFIRRKLNHLFGRN